MTEYQHDPLTQEQDGDIVVPADAIDGMWQSNGSFDHVMGQAVDDFKDEVEEITDEPSKRKERQQAIRQNHGFFATSKGELVRATGLSRPDIQGTIAGGAKYIAIVVQRNANLDPKPDDPSAAGRAVTSEFVGYAKQARGDRAALDYLAQIIGADSDVLPSSSLSSVRHFEGWKDDGLLARAVTDLKRLTEQIEFVDGKGSDPLEGGYSLKDKQDVKTLQEFVSSLSIREAVDLIRQSSEQHESQLKFWIQTIEQIEKFSSGATKAIAKTALTNLGAVRPE